jgi:hypothetical protein
MSFRAILVGLCVVLSACGTDEPNTGQSDHLNADASADGPGCPPTPEEPTSSMQTAVDTGVASMTSTFAMTGMAICPAGDQDFFEVEITQTTSDIEVVIEHAAMEPAVAGSLLNSTGIPIRNSMAVPGTAQTRIDATYLPAGVYYVETYALPGATSHYKLDLSVTTP